MKGIRKTIKNETKEQKGFLGTSLGTLRATLLGNMLTRRGILRTGYGNKEGKGISRAVYGFSIKKKINSTPSFNKLLNTEVLSEWT